MRSKTDHRVSTVKHYFQRNHDVILNLAEKFLLFWCLYSEGVRVCCMSVIANLMQNETVWFLMTCCGATPGQRLTDINGKLKTAPCTESLASLLLLYTLKQLKKMSIWRNLEEREPRHAVYKHSLIHKTIWLHLALIRFSFSAASRVTFISLCVRVNIFAMWTDFPESLVINKPDLPLWGGRIAVTRRWPESVS